MVSVPFQGSQFNRAGFQCQAGVPPYSVAPLELPGDPDPVGVDRVGIRPVDSPVGVGTEVVSLGLEEVGRKASPAVAVAIGQRRAEGRSRDPQLDGLANHAAPGGLVLIDRLEEEGVEQQVVQVRSIGEGIPYSLEEASPDNAAASPHQRDAAVIEVPVVLFRRGADEGIALSVGADL